MLPSSSSQFSWSKQSAALVVRHFAPWACEAAHTGSATLACGALTGEYRGVVGGLARSVTHQEKDGGLRFANPPYEGSEMPPKILVSCPSAEVAAIAREMAPKGFETVVVHNDAEVVPNLDGIEYMITYPHIPMRDPFYQAAPKLKLVQLLSAGYDNVDLEAARRARVPLSNNGGANAISVSEHALMLMLTVSRKVIWQHGSVSGGRPRGNGPAPPI